MVETVWTSLLENPKFIREIKEKGFSKERKFIDYVNKNNLSVFNGSGAKTALHLSIDFYSKQASELTEKNLFLLRTGRGKFIVFDNKRFDRSYLNLNTKQAEEIDYEIPPDYQHLYDAFKKDITENASIEQLHFLKVFKKIIEETTQENEYYIGTRGNKSSKFDVYMHDKILNKNINVFTYNGQEELDYSLFTKKSIYFFEGKSVKNNGLDIGWHKIIFPASRFKQFNKKLIPGYFLKTNKIVYFFIFPEFSFYEEGIILNDINAMTPKKVYKIDLTKY